MIDSLVVVGDQAAAWGVDYPVVEDCCGEGEQSSGDGADEAGECAAAVALERELVFERVEAGFDPLTDATEGAEAGRLVSAVGAQELGAEGGDLLLELAAGEAFVGNHGLAGLEGTLEQLGGDNPFGRVRWGELEADRQPVRGAEQVEAEAPEPTAVRRAEAVAGEAGELGALDRLA